MKKYFTHLLALVACFAWSTTASAQYSATVEEFPVGYEAKPVTFSLNEVAATLGTDAATLGSALTTWLDVENNPTPEVNYVFLADPTAEGADNYTQGGRGGFWMTKESAIIGWSGDGSNGDAWYNTFDVDIDEGSIIFGIGQHPDAFEAGEEVSAKWYIVFNGKEATFDITLKVIEDTTPPVELPEAVTKISELTIVGEQTVNVEQEPRTNYSADAVTVDLTGVAALLGTTDDVIAKNIAELLYTTTFVDEDGLPIKTDSLTKEASAGAPGWWFGQVWDYDMATLGNEVVRKAYGNDDSFYIEAFSYDAESFTLSGNLGQYPSNLSEDDVRIANVYLIWGDKAYHITYNLTIIKKEVTGLDAMNMVGSADAEVTFEVTDGYDGDNISIDLGAVLEALGVEDIKDVTIMVKDGEGLSVSNTANNGGSWLNIDGELTSWGNNSTFYFEPEVVSDVADWSNVYVGQYPNALEGDTDYNFSIYFVNGDNYYVVNVTIHALPSSVEPGPEPGEEVAQSEWYSVGTKTINIQVVPDASVYEIPMHYTYDGAEVAEMLDTDKPVLYALAVPNEEDPEADKYTNGYTCTPYPGFWMNRDGYVTNWNGSESPWGATFDIEKAEVTFYQFPGFADNVPGKVYKAPMILVNPYTGAYVTFNINLTFVSEIVETETVGEKELPLSVVTGETEVHLDITEILEALGFETAYDLINSNQGLTYMLADGTFSSGSRAEDGVMLTEKGVLDESEGYVDSKIYVRMEEDGDKGIVLITEGIDFAEGDRVEAKIGFQNEGKLYILNVIFLDPEAYLSVGSLKMNTKDAPVYDLSGRRVNNPAQRGIYIQAGRKVAVK